MLQFSRFFYVMLIQIAIYNWIVEIIIEYVLIDNLVINFLILFLSAKVLSSKITWWRLLISNIFGTAMSFLFPILMLPSYLLILLKLLVGVIMILIAYKIKTFKSFALHFATFLSITALFGGITFMISYFAYGSLEVLNNSYSKNFPMGVIIGIIAAYCYVLIGVINYIIKKQKTKKFIYDLKIFTNDKTYKISAYLDSAHNLIDPISNESVIIINFETFNKIFKLPMEKLIQKDVSNLKNAHYIDYKTINKTTQKMLVFNIEKVEIDLIKSKLKKENAVLGLSFSNFKNNFNCDALISPTLI